ncbi:MAG: PEP-CTERM sorting domain-containing protein [Rhodocyclaceae bacterium]|nr:MAG: PEP-CTERM sorting domain-containing protein [Rhodocyclaceae bacterium]
MKFNLKTLVAAVALVAAAGANAAAIDTGAGGNGGLFFNVWDATGSYTRNLGVDLTSFETAVNGAANGVQVYNFAADSTLTSWLSGKSSFSWNIMAVDNQGAVRVLETAGQSATLTAKASNIVRTAALQTTTLVGSINAPLASANSATYTTADAGYVGKAAGGVSTINSNIGWPTAALGSAANNSYAAGLLIEEANGNAAGTTVVANTILGNANGARAYFDANNTLVIQTADAVAAVPEPETYAMFLAGLGLMGVIARRRGNRA